MEKKTLGALTNLHIHFLQHFQLYSVCDIKGLYTRIQNLIFNR